MPLVCFAPGCKSGYASERRTGTKHHYFRLPKDEELGKIWKCKIPRLDREMAAHDVLCDIHFDPKDVVTHDVFTINGEIVKVARERYKLVTGAQPVHFPHTTHRNKTSKKRKNSPPEPKLCMTTRKRAKTIENGANQHPEAKTDPKTAENNPDATKLPKLCKNTRIPPQKHAKIIENSTNQHSEAKTDPKTTENNPHATKLPKLCKNTRIPPQKHAKIIENNANQHSEAKTDPETTENNPDATKLPKLCKNTRIPPRKHAKIIENNANQHSEAKTDPKTAENNLDATKLPKLCKNTRIPPQKHAKIIENNANQHSEAKTDPKTTENNPDATKLQNLRTRNASLHRLLKIKRKKYTKVLNKLRYQTDAFAVAKSQLELYKPITRKTQLFIKEIVRRETRRTKTIRYHKDTILDSVLFRIKSPDGYLHCLNHGLAPQPSKASYSRLLSKLRCDFMKNNDSMQLLAEKLENKNQNERFGVLALKEIEIHEAIDENGTNMRFDGFVDYAEATSEKADKGLIFVFKPLIGEWSLVITRYALREETPGNVLAKLFLEIVINAENAGAKVVALVSNGGETNARAVHALGFDGRRGNLINSVPHPYDPDTRRLFCLYDVPKVLESIRDCFEKRGKCKFLKWSLDFGLYVGLVKRESGKPEMFSRSTVTRLRISRGMKRGSQDLEEFTCFFSQLGDIFNSDGLHENSDNHKFLMDVDKTLNSTKTSNNTVMSTKTLERLRLTIRSALHISNFLWARGSRRICTKKLNHV